MAGSFVHTPVRFISLPSKLYPVSHKIEAELSKIKALESSSTTPLTTAESIQAGLTKLAEQYNSIEGVIHSPHTRQALHHQQHVKLVEAALHGSTGLLDACCITTDLISMLKEQVQDLQSALRRRGGDSSIESNIHAYISFRRKSKKDIAKCLKSLKRMESNIIAAIPFVDHNLLMVVNMLRESSALTISVFRSILLFLSMPVMKTKVNNGWLLLSKLIPIVAERDDQKMLNEVGSVDVVVYSLYGQIRKNDAKIDVQMALKRLKKLDFSIKGLEDVLDCLSRRLIQHRVCLLDILTP